jgi:hypothetical protein
MRDIDSPTDQDGCGSSASSRFGQSRFGRPCIIEGVVNLQKRNAKRRKGQFPEEILKLHKETYFRECDVHKWSRYFVPGGTHRSRS